MKDVKLLVWLSQLGLSVAVPLGGFVLLSVWLRNVFQLGVWVVFVGLALGLYCAIAGLFSSLKTLSRMAGEKKDKETIVGFNDHD